MSTAAYEQAQNIIDEASHIVVIQAENPDGDSLGSALALEAMLDELGKKVTLYCAIEIPKYLRYAVGWDRVTSDFPKTFDASIIVDTASSALLEKTFVPAQLAALTAHPIVVIDHHLTKSDLPFEFAFVNNSKAVATGEVIYDLAKKQKWPVPADAAENLALSILADSLGLVTETTTAHSIHTLAELVEHGARVSDIENRRREFMRKSPEILEYKGRLLQRIEYHLDNQLAIVHIPWDEIKEYSDQYNPSVLVLDEMRLVEGVRVAVAIKTYPDGRLTGKIRTNPDAKIAEIIAGYFGGGGHGYTAGFKIYDRDYEKIKLELIGAAQKALSDLQ
ncbi:MAG TPA: DHH family phosphoesterase [Candidatus Saccharimonadales bacterium]|nr:DHH family phosphoesterase [Candidatus Saccharimonadales bacterium]